MPMSINLNTSDVRGHWATVEAGATSVGRVADRAHWRVSREVCVAETDASAWKLAVEGGWAAYGASICCRCSAISIS